MPVGTTEYQNGPGVDDKLSLKTGSDVKYFLADHLGSTVGLADAAGTVAAVQSYDAFGNGADAAFPTRYQFTGREFDRPTGLQYSRARWYHPAIGRFISEDPIGFAGGDVNLYAYVGSRPIDRADPYGTIGLCLGVMGQPVPCNPFPFASDPSWPYENVFDKGWNAERNAFPNGDLNGSADPYGGAYRHCVATCYLYRRYGIGGRIFRNLWDWVQEDANDENSRGDMKGEDNGAIACSVQGKTCEEGCLTYYPGR